MSGGRTPSLLGAMAEIGVVHLVRARNGLKPFKDFLRSYAEHPSGVEHDLIVVFKGFRGKALPAEYQQAVSGVRHRTLFARDFGFDLRAYGLAARSFPCRYFCFLNSFSVLLDAKWLEKLTRAVAQPGVGLVGATGSWESMYSNLLVAKPRDPAASPLARLWQPLRIQSCKWFFEPFPNCHLRTNAFMISRELMLRVWPRWVLTKRGAYLFESGRRSLTQRIHALRLKALVVGRDGQAYASEDWARSRTFRQGNQENLLVADNQTREYACADTDTRQSLSRLAWGEQADPGTGELPPRTKAQTPNTHIVV